MRHQFKPGHALLRRAEVQSLTGHSRSTIYLRISQGLWPKPVSLGPRSVGWPAREVEAINAARIAGKTDDDIRSIVTQLEAERHAGADGRDEFGG